MADLALAPPPACRSLLLWSGLALLALLLFGVTLLSRPPLPGDAATAALLDRVLLWHSLLPRAATAILAGAALGLAGALLQRVLRNPIADPSTLGIASGAQLALTAATLHLPALLAISREGVAFAGGVAAVLLVLGLSWRRGLEPVTVVLSGMTVSLIASALAAALVLANADYVLSLFIWGAGSLHQQNWEVALVLATRLAGGVLAAALLLRPLALLGLDDASARSLGLALHTTRFLVIAVAVWLAASVTAEVGMIGFIGLAAPAFARIAGARGPRQQLLLAPLLGALLLWLTDGLVQLGSGLSNDLLPTGAATGLLGGPLLLWLLPRLSRGGRPPPALAPAAPVRPARPGRRLALLIFAGLLLVLLSLTLGRDPEGWNLAGGQLLGELLPFRGPRVAAALAAGALLGVSGLLLQRLTGNPLAGPEVLGVSAGAGVGLSLVLLLAALPTLELMLAGSAGGALAALLLILAFGAWSGFGPERLLLAGIALGAFCLAFLSAVLASGDARAFTLLVWLAGSTDRVEAAEAWSALGAALLLLLPLLLLVRWIDLLPLGETMGRALGLPLRRARLLLALCAALAAALASFVVGPLSLVGLVGPHLARLLGFLRGPRQLLAAALLGAELMLLADWLGRVVIFPYQIPAGLFAALIGGPYLVWLLHRTAGGAR